MLLLSVVQNDIQQRFVDLDAAAVVNKAQLAKAVHEEADARPGCADHLRQGLLRDLAEYIVSGSPGLPNSAMSRRMRAKRFSLELKS